MKGPPNPPRKIPCIEADGEACLLGPRGAFLHPAATTSFQPALSTETRGAYTRSGSRPKLPGTRYSQRTHGRSGKAATCLLSGGSRFRREFWVLLQGPGDLAAKTVSVV